MKKSTIKKLIGLACFMEFLLFTLRFLLNSDKFDRYGRIQISSVLSVKLTFYA